MKEETKQRIAACIGFLIACAVTFIILEVS